MSNKTFEERNLNSYTKYSDVSLEIINKYKNVLPEYLIKIWETIGFGIYEEGFLQLVNPEEYEFVFDYIDKLLEPSIVFGVTAFGDILLWEGNENWTISPDEGNRVKIINIRKCYSRALNSLIGTLNVFFDDYFKTHKDYFDSKPYLEIKDILPKLQYGQCYGYVPALSLGGKASNKNLQIVDTKAYIEIIGQSVGKIIDLE
ncbi:GAD-like domain-containing protein [Empedobacter sedimenti]|uniref:GAD-like domain-containing protein n=1 Tax=Empedobacter sedimenti TaxID=3042610 RepID=UPI0024A7395E|nr:GAD-like domain-containing protein [Empedobacter sedimenti]